LFRYISLCSQSIVFTFLLVLEQCFLQVDFQKMSWPFFFFKRLFFSKHIVLKRCGLVFSKNQIRFQGNQFYHSVQLFCESKTRRNVFLTWFNWFVYFSQAAAWRFSIFFLRLHFIFDPSWEECIDSFVGRWAFAFSLWSNGIVFFPNLVACRQTPFWRYVFFSLILHQQSLKFMSKIGCCHLLFL